MPRVRCLASRTGGIHVCCFKLPSVWSFVTAARESVAFHTWRAQLGLYRHRPGEQLSGIGVRTGHTRVLC